MKIDESCINRVALEVMNITQTLWDLDDTDAVSAKLYCAYCNGVHDMAELLKNELKKDEPQTEPLPKAINGVKIADAVAWADKWLEDNPVSEMWDMIRTLRDATEWQDEPQTDCAWR